ncbi:uncharacterized protein LOC122320499 [Drosophila ficusphila]|uniref:uncharacterized protein LOC122320499 n=1 Tax=Drosophila ficusphila TaxID=30025 RepID=UPI001C892F1E|nr:uncharacterized protein LOC122320499 [Drosophila ficusphila]
MIPSLGSASSLWMLILLLLVALSAVSSNCCTCPSTRCSIPQWPCCNKKSKWWNSVFG